ncbi:hypothetical protein LTR08_006489 [Meristemomyces frigidus]|nr:hypothetical protein LTR08_006489 [Meristemomyces frigidus]
MAQGRVYRDYFSDQDSGPRRSPSIRQALSPSNSSRANRQSDDEKIAGFREYGNGIGIAHTIDEDEMLQSVDYEDESSEPVLHEGQIDLHSPGSAVDSAPPDIDETRALSPATAYEQRARSPATTYERRARSPASTTYEPRAFSPASTTYEQRAPGIYGKRTSFSTTNIHEKSATSPSVTTASSVSQRDAHSSSVSSGSKMPEFFGHTAFQTGLHNPSIAHNLQNFGESRLCGENMAFLTRVSKYHVMLNDISQAMLEIHRDFLSATAPSQVNIPQQLQSKVNNEVKRSLTSTLPTLESVFVNAQDEIERLVQTDIWPNFVRNQMSLSAARALGGNRAKYMGLGDCFVLTDPAKADNPIVFASDGFVKVTGYTRNEIIPRNCRFLQSRHTDRAAVKRLKAAIDKREESVELLLNTKKNGEPFWNLLYTTPLFDAHGNLVFFLGGQINCSTTIHNASDVLRILSQTNEIEKEPTPSVMPPAPPSARRSILSSFRTRSSSKLQQGSPGMENTLLDRIGDRDLKGQMRSFYTAYSNFIIINYSTFLITFVSAGIVDMLFPIKAKTAAGHAQAAGIDIFKFLTNHGSGSVGWDFKSNVKSALKVGQAISLDLKLCARPYMGFEKFVLHWTPLKDETGLVSWIVLTLGSEQRL